MELATINNGDPDGALVVVSDDGTRMIDALTVAPTLQSAIENWDKVEAGLQSLHANFPKVAEPLSATPALPLRFRARGSG